MDERFRGKRWWVVLGVLGLVGLCLASCAAVALFSIPMRAAPIVAGETGGLGPGLMGGHHFFRPFGLLFLGGGLFLAVVFGGVVLLTLARMVRWMAWGPPPPAPGGEGASGQGPWHGPWHGPWRGHWGPPAPPAEGGETRE